MFLQERERERQREQAMDGAVRSGPVFIITAGSFHKFLLISTPNTHS